MVYCVYTSKKSNFSINSTRFKLANPRPDLYLIVIVIGYHCYPYTYHYY